MISKSDIVKEMCQVLSDILSSDNDKQAFLSAISSFEQSKNMYEFEFSVNKVLDNDLIVDINKMIDQRSAHFAELKSHRADLWRQSVISATNVKHNAPIEYADKVVERYDELFKLK